MLAIEKYNVQEVRRLAREEAEQRLKLAIKLLLDNGESIIGISNKMNMTEQEIIDLLK